MIDIQWKGKIGYGDIVSPICYAHTLSRQLDQEVSLTFRWDTGPTHKIVPEDPETLWERASYLHHVSEKSGTRVTLYHAFNAPLDINHTNYDWDVVGNDRFHNYWPACKDLRHIGGSNTIVVNSTNNNQQSLKDYGKSWKDPAAGLWPIIIDGLLKQGFDIDVVDYRTPVSSLVTKLQRARGFLGYHGTAAWVARFVQTPSIILTAGKLTHTAFPNAYIMHGLVSVNRFNTDFKDNLRRAVKVNNICVDKFSRYKVPLTTVEHLNIL
jgi:hypothetical protein